MALSRQQKLTPCGKKTWRTANGRVDEQPLYRAAACFGREPRVSSLRYSLTHYNTKQETQMIATLNSMIRDDEGVTMVEYGLLVALIAIVALAAVKVLGTNLSTLFNTVATTI
jgi:pilus assembly protein Flp/PilA